LKGAAFSASTAMMISAWATMMISAAMLISAWYQSKALETSNESKT
jgi:hypothetical protein